MPDEPNIPARLAAVWQACLARPRAIFGLAILVQGVAGLVAAPVAVAQLQRLSTTLNGPPAGPTGTARVTEAVFPAHAPLVILGTVASISLTYGAILVLTAGMAVLLLSARDEDHSIRASLRTLARHAMDLVLALTAVVFGATVFVWLEVALDGSSEALSTTGTDPGAASGQAFVLELVVLAGVLLVFYGAVRWSVALPTMVLERRTLRAALSRSSDLTRGRRLSIALTLVVVSLLEGIPFAIAATVPALLIGPGTGIDRNFILSSLLTYLAWILLAPFVPLAIVFMYRDFAAAGPRPPD